MIKLDLYRIFSKVAECRSFSKAARELYMTQPAVSQAVSQLENDLGIRLFTRTSKGVTLTNEGQLLNEYTASAISLLKAGEKKLFDSKNLTDGELKVGVGDTISKYFLLTYLEKFHTLYPNINLKIINRTTPELCYMLKAGEIDIAVCNLPVKDTAFEIKECIKVHDIFICGKNYAKLINRPLYLSEIASYPLILLETKSNSRKYVESYLASKSIKIKPEIELGSHELLLEFAKINLGIACVTKEFSTEYLESGVLHEIETVDKIPERSIGFCFLKSVSLSHASAKFIEIAT